MPHPRLIARLFALLFMSITPAAGAGATSVSGRVASPYLAQTTRWRAVEGQFASWQRNGVTLASNGALQLDLRTASSATDPYRPGAYNGHNFYNGGSFLVGEAISPMTASAFRFTQAIPSWNADTPPGTWVEVQLRARLDSGWTRWYNMGVWASDSSTITPHSVGRQTGSNGRVSTDTLLLGTSARPLGAGAFQLKVRLFSANRGEAPTVRNAAVAISTTPARPAVLAPGQESRWNKVLQVPECSQMVYPDGGEVWCSPTSTSMVLGYWAGGNGSCERRVRAAVDGVYDSLYDGHGNWPFNAAYAASQGMEGYIARFTGLADAEPWIAAGVPVIFSFGWGRGQLSGAPISSSNGHLAVLVGFDASGNPIVNDPAAPANESVQRTYRRAQLERLWLEHSGGTVYLIYPPGHAVPGL
jgi:hypothetical protein